MPDFDLGWEALLTVLSGRLTDAQIATGAGIQYSKLNLTGQILNADLAGSIAYSKLILTNSIVNADINSSAAIDKTKIATAGRWAKTDLPASAVYTDQVNTFGAFDQKFQDTHLKIVASADASKIITFDNSSMTASVTLSLKSLSSTSQTLQIPNITTTDTIAVLSLAQSLLNKTIDASLNTLENISTATIKTGDPLLVKSSTIVVRANISNYEAINGNTGASTTDTDFGNLMNTITASFSGSIILKDGTFTTSTPVNYTVDNSHHIKVEGQGTATQIVYTGTGYGWTIHNAGTNKTHFTISDIFFNGSTKTTGRNGISIGDSTSTGSSVSCTMERCFLRNFDNGILYTNTNGFEFHDNTVMDCNTGVQTTTGSASAPNWFVWTGGSVQFCTNQGIWINADAGSSTNTYIKTIFENCGTPIQLDGSGQVFTIDNCYFELTTGTCDIWVKGVDSGQYLDEVTINMCRTNCSIANFIQLDWVKHINIINPVSKSVSGGLTQAMILFNQINEYSLNVENPQWNTNPTASLFHTNIVFNTATNRIQGTVKDKFGLHQIAYGGFAVVAGDIVAPSGAAVNIYSKPSSDNQPGARIVSYGNLNNNDCFAYCIAGHATYLSAGGFVFGDKLVTIASSFNAQVDNTDIDPTHIIGIALTSSLAQVR